MKSIIRFTAIFFQIITVSALMAHLLETPAKLGLSMENYRVVQSIYQDWTWLGIFEVSAIICSVAWLILDRKKNLTKKLLLASSALFTFSFIIFFVFTMPANSATQNWTVMPKEWETLRQDWEYSYVVRALLNLIGVSLQLLAFLHIRTNSYRRITQTHIIPINAEAY